MVWGSDWPHPSEPPEYKPDDAVLFDLLAVWAPDNGTRHRILVENRSTNTGENVLFTRRVLAEKGLDPQAFIVVQKPYMERRSYATFRKVWPEKEVRVASPQMAMDEYLSQYSHDALSPDDVVYTSGAPAMTDTVARIARAAGARCYTDPFLPNANPVEQAKAAR